MANARDGGASVSVAVSGITASSGTVTYATSSTTGLFAGQTVTVSGATASGYNGTFTIASVTTNTNFTVTSAATGSTSTATAVGYTGNPRIDFAWGNVPLQPDDDRQSSPSQTVTVGGAGNVSWTNYGTLASAKLATSNISTTLNGKTYLTEPDNHVRAAQGWDAYPASPTTTGIPTNSTVTTVPALLGTTLKYAVDKLHDTGFDVGTITYTTTGALPNDVRVTVTGASNSAGTITYTAANSFVAGQLVSVVGLGATATPTLTGATVNGTGTSTTVTFATANTTGIVVGSVVTIAGATGATVGTLNGTWYVSAVTANTSFTAAVYAPASITAASPVFTSATVSVVSGFNLGTQVVLATSLSSTQFLVTPTVSASVTLPSAALTTQTGTATAIANVGTIKTQSLAAGASSTQGTAVDLSIYRYQDGTTPGIVVPGGYVAG